MNIVPITQAAPVDLPGIRALVQDEMAAVDVLIERRLRSHVGLVNQLGHYIVHSGGKRLRPLLVLLAARAADYPGEHHVPMAAIIEFIHTATLLHDDVVDASQFRRGHETANAIWGNQASVLVGDFLYSRAFEMMVEVGIMRIMEVMARTTNTIAEGEVMQLGNCHNVGVSEEQYLEVIRRKTAALFEAAVRVGAILAGFEPEQERALARYGLHLGIAYQLIDDALDYSGSPEQIGKSLGDDLAEGKPTLPLLYVLHQGDPEDRVLVRRAIEEGGRSRIAEVTRAIESTGAIAYTAALARQEAQTAMQALQNLSRTRFRDALLALAEFAVQRNY